MNIRRLFRKDSKDPFRPVERLVLQALAISLPPHLAEILKEHSAGTNLVQRFDHGREVNLYRKERVKLMFPERKFSFDKDEFLLATVTLKNPERKGLIAVKVWVVNGRLFQLKFNAPVEKMKAAYDVRSVDLNPKLFSDAVAMQKGPILESLSLRWKVDEIQSPLSGERRASALEIIKNPLPQDFLDVIHEADGFKIEHWTILGLESIYKLPGDSKSSVLAESSGATMHRQDLVLVVKAGEYSVLKCADLADNPVDEKTFLAVLDRILASDMASLGSSKLFG